MNKVKIFLLFISSLLISNCSEENITDPIDSELQKNIIGTWVGNSGYSITFYSNGLFKDSIYFEGIQDTSYYNYGLFIRTGKYDISNSVLMLSEFYFTKVITEASIGMAYVSRPVEISITNNVLKRKMFALFYNIGEGKNTLWDKWESNEWLCQADAVDSLQNLYGTYKQIYHFVEDSSQYSHSSTFHNLINDSTYTYESKRNFTYNAPYLDLPVEADYNMLVQFKNNKMYWYYDGTPEDLVKIK